MIYFYSPSESIPHRFVFRKADDEQLYFSPEGRRVVNPAPEMTKKQKGKFIQSLEAKKKRFEGLQNSLRDAKARLEELDRQKKALQEQLGRLRGEHQGLTSTVAGLEQELERILAEEARIQALIQELEESVARIDQLIQQFEAELVEYRRELGEEQRLQTRLDDEQKRLEAEQKDAEKWLKGTDHLLDLFEDFSQWSTANTPQELKEVTKGVREQRDEDRAELDKLTKDLKKNRADLTAAGQRLEALEREIDAGEHKVEEKKGELEAIRTDLGRRNSEIQQEHEKKARTEATLSHTRSELERVLGEISTTESSERSVLSEEKAKKRIAEKKERQMELLKPVLRDLLQMAELLLRHTETSHGLSVKTIEDLFKKIDGTWKGTLRKLFALREDLELSDGLKKKIEQASGYKFQSDFNDPHTAITTYIRDVKMTDLMKEMMVEIEAMPENTRKRDHLQRLKPINKVFAGMEEVLKNAFLTEVQESKKVVKPLKPGQRSKLQSLVDTLNVLVSKS